MADSEEHRLLQTLRQTSLQDAAARETLYRKIIDALDMADSNYLILLAADTYDVPHRGKDGLTQADADAIGTAREAILSGGTAATSGASASG